MITAYVGCIDKKGVTPISGTGKTLSMVGVGYQNKRRYNKTIWSNFETDFSDEVMGFQEMIDTIGDEPHPHLELMITEMGKIINSLGSSVKKALYIENFARQLRKVDVNVSYDEQRFNSLHLRLRNFTDTIFIPEKFHFDGSPCNYNLCKKPHVIKLFSYEPPIHGVRVIFNAPVVGGHYNTKEISFDTLTLPTKGGE